MAMHATSDNLGSKLKATSAPRKIDLAEEMALHGVDVPQEISEAIPSNDAVFLGYQQRWFEDESPIMIAEKSRRTGLTWAEAGRNVINAAKPRRRGGCNTFYVGSKQEMALEYIAACALFARAFNELAEADVYEQTFWDEGKKEEILTYMIRFPKSGRKIQALSSRPSNLRGLQGDVVIDEAAFHESLEELLKAALALTMWGNKVRLISTHNGVDNPFNQYIQDAREGRKDYSVHRITLDDAIVEGLYKRICFVTGQEWSPEAEKAWRDGLYKNAPQYRVRRRGIRLHPEEVRRRLPLSRAHRAGDGPGPFDPYLPVRGAGRFRRLDATDARRRDPHLVRRKPSARAGQAGPGEHPQLRRRLRAPRRPDRVHPAADLADPAQAGGVPGRAAQPDLRSTARHHVLHLRSPAACRGHGLRCHRQRRIPRGTGGAAVWPSGGRAGQPQPCLVRRVDAQAQGEFEAFNIELSRHQSTLDDLLRSRSRTAFQ
ncbi:hypothetical protein P4237_00130 [Pseudomonas aeruginosa]|nr:hypothetical protein [Pseudomonas aeruginosa]